MGRSPHGERGLKSHRRGNRTNHTSRSPHGERGLKSLGVEALDVEAQVALLMESVD